MMEQITTKAIEGGWDGEWDNTLGPIKHMGTENQCGKEYALLDPFFWQALSRMVPNFDWRQEAHHFFELNLTEGWDAAVAYLQEVTK